MTIQESLVTPQLETDLPGENWFFYWKTSSSLWKTKLQGHTGHHLIMIPIYWAFHTETGDHFDFGDKRPETNLSKLAKLVREIGKEPIFLVPLTPCPFLPNGGIPPLLARTMGLGDDFRAQAVVDAEGRVHKMYSFFDPRVYQAFRKLVWELGQYFVKTGMTADVMGLIAGHTTEDKYQTYLEDSSRCFDQGFSRYLNAMRQDNQITNGRVADLEDKTVSLSGPREEEKQKLNYTRAIEDLYIQSAKECLSPSWAGTLKYSFIGGTPQDLMSRGLQVQEDSGRYINNLLRSLTLDVIPSSVLLPHETRSGALLKILKDTLSSALIEKKRGQKLYEQDFNTAFVPLAFFDVYIPKEASKNKKIDWESIGLISFLDQHFRWTYLIQESFEHVVEHDYQCSKVAFVSSEGMSAKDIHFVLRMFMNGGTIVLDRAEMPAELDKKLECFFIENSISLEKTNGVCPLTYAKLGAGKLLVVEGDLLKQAGASKQNQFWGDLIGHLEIPHLEVLDEPGVQYFWKTRSPTSSELSFEEVRRVCLYNPTSYKKKVKLFPKRNFAFIKYIDEVHSKVESGPQGVQIEMLPNGSVSLDFGFFED